MKNIIEILKRKVRFFQKKLSGNYKHFKKDIKIKSEWHGNLYGGFYLSPRFINENSIVYSFGIGEDLSFDRSISDRFGCEVNCFDPTPKSLEWIAKQSHGILQNLKIFDYGLSRHTQTATFFLPKNSKNVSGSIVSQSAVNPDDSIQVELKSINDIVREFKHDNIDVLKMDIEGAEYDFINGLSEHSIRPKQLLIEFHDRLFPDEPNITKDAIECLRNNGYLLFNVSDIFEEASFIHTSIVDP